MSAKSGTIIKKSFFTQDELVSRLRQEGFIGLTPRILKYWREQGYLQPLIREGSQYYIPEDDLPRIKMLSLNKGLKSGELMTLHEIEGNTFYIRSIEIKRYNGQPVLQLHTDNGFLVIQKKEEGKEILDALFTEDEDSNL